jgi:hypothetical protein
LSTQIVMDFTSRGRLAECAGGKIVPLTRYLFGAFSHTSG